MPTPSGQENSIAYGAYPYAYMNGLMISNDLTTPATLLDVAAGVTIDSTDTFQMINNGTLVINALNTGLNGLDTGTFAAATLYCVYLISDPVTLRPISAMLSLSYTAPLMPFGYSAFKLIGYASTASGSATFTKAWWTNGNGGLRLMMYDAVQLTSVTAGTAGTYTAINLTGLVPLGQNVPVLMYANFIPTAAGSNLNVQPANGTGAAAQVTGQVTGQVIAADMLVFCHR
jgi:hypothetical protein